MTTIDEAEVAKFTALAARDDISSLIAVFEEAILFDDNKNEYWLARQLQVLLGYTNWQNFSLAIERAKQACLLSKHDIENHFIEVFTEASKNSSGGRPSSDYHLSRYACYLIAQNSDSRKKQVAFAQTYFAIQTRKQELQDKNVREDKALLEAQKRLMLREEMSEHNKMLASAAKNAGVIKPVDYAIFQNYGYKGLYGGLDRGGIQRSKGLKDKQNILDHMGSTELAANLFRATQAEEKLIRDKIKGKNAANNAHLEVGKKVREAIKDIGGTMPENLPVAEDIKKVTRRVAKTLTQKDEP
jgi:DNA-damage-inducible protein D